MKAYEIISWLEKRYPTTSAQEWDNVGFLVGDDRKEVSHIFLALDLTEKVLEEAIQLGADMIITHHPMIFSGIKKINNHTFTGRKILRLIQKDIPYYAMHTNYDVLGMAELSADYLNLRDRTVLSVTEESDTRREGFGRVGKLPHKMSLLECAQYVKKCNHLSDVRFYGDPDMEIETVAICTGSGKSMLKDVLKSGAQVYITGDIDHHTGIDAVAQGIGVIDAGHYGTEYIFAKEMKRILEEAFSGVQISCAKVENPYTVV